MGHQDQERERARTIRLRKGLGWSQMRLAKKAGIDRGKLSSWECGYLDLRQEELEAVESALREIVEVHAAGIERLRTEFAATA